MNAFFPYGAYWSTPFAKWQGSIAHLNPLKLVAQSGQRVLASRQFPLEAIDLDSAWYREKVDAARFGVQWLLPQSAWRWARVRRRNAALTAVSGSDTTGA